MCSHTTCIQTALQLQLQCSWNAVGAYTQRGLPHTFGPDVHLLRPFASQPVFIYISTVHSHLINTFCSADGQAYKDTIFTWLLCTDLLLRMIFIVPLFTVVHRLINFIINTEFCKRQKQVHYWIKIVKFSKSKP